MLYVIMFFVLSSIESPLGGISMIQFSDPFETKEDFRSILDRVRSSPSFDSASDILAIAALGHQDPSFAEELIQIYNEVLDRGSFCGYTAADVVEDGHMNEGKNTVTFFLFDSSTCEVIPCDTEIESSEDVGHRITKLIEENEDCRALMIFPDVYHAKRLDLFLSALSFKDPEFPVCGAAAGGLWKEGITSPIFVFSDRVIECGILSILLFGEDLYVKAAALRGWSPIGRGHTVTKLASPLVVSEVDNLPATSIYKKYFKIDEKDPYFVQNILAFPWVLNRSNELVPRSIISVTEEGNLVFGSDVNEGERFHFSYGNVTAMLNDSYSIVKNYVPFAPETVYLMVCDNRQFHLGEEETKEITLFKDAFPSIAGAGAFGEFFHLGDKVEAFNCTMLALFLREGPVKETSISEMKEPEALSRGLIPLQDRLFTFLKETSDEYSTLRARERERELHNRIKLEHAASEAKSEFLSNVSHEIRTPINAILGMNEMILRESTEERILDYSEDIRSAGNSLLSLVNDILDFSKIEAGKLNLLPVEYSFSSTLNDIVNMITPLASKKGLEVIVDYDENIPDRLYGDTVRIRQVLINIMNNAVKFTDEGSVKLTVGFQKTKRDEINLEFHCIDTGIGIKEEDMEKLFSPFEQIDDSNKNRIDGTGLGMSISKNLLNIMGSKLNVKSEYKKGSDFSFIIRQKVFSFEPIGSYMKETRKKGIADRVLKESFHAPDAIILITDDMDVNLSVAKNLLKRTKINIDTALSGHEAIKLCQEKKYDIIFMDHRMPVMDGTEAMRRIHALPPGNPNEKTPIIALTANAVAGSREKFLEDGFDGYIPKPIDPAALESLIKELLPPGKVIMINEEDDDLIGVDALSPFLKSLLTIPDIDVADGVTSCGGNETYEKVLMEFSLTAADKINVIKKDLEEEDYKDYTIRVHSLKSTARLAGAKTLSRHAAYLEKCGDTLRTEEIIRKTPRLLNEYKRLAAAIEKAVPKEDPSTKKDITVEMLEEAYQAIYESVLAFDYDGADNVMAELQGYRIPEEEEERFNKLTLLLSNVDHDGIEAMFRGSKQSG